MEASPTLLENLDRLGAWGILTTDCDLRIVGWNRWLERHSGKPANEVLGKSLFDLYPDLRVRNLDRYYRQALDGQASILSQRFHKYLLAMPPTVTSVDLMHMQQTVRISPLTEGGETRGTLTLIEDVTERVATEQELRKQAQSLEEANRHKDEFLALLGHELRNPLAPIRSGIQLLNDIGSKDPEAQEAREIIDRQVSHMARLVDDLLDVSRIIRGKVRLRLEPFDLLNVLRQVAYDYQPILADNGIELSVELPGGACWVMGDCLRLSQIVANLLHNSNKFTNSGGKVCLAAEVDLQRRVAFVRVSDSGIGMSPETLRRVFDAFAQAECSLDRSKGGLGLGLALVKGLAELHGGTVSAASEGIGRGSTFTISLPVEIVEPNPQKTPREIDLDSRTEGKRVLLIEDNRDAAQMMKMLISRMGFSVDISYSGPDGLDQAKKTSPEIIICDIGLPGLDGFEVARALRSDVLTRDAFLIAQSGYGQAEDIRQALASGFDLHLIKPVDFAKLEQTLRDASRTTRRQISGSAIGSAANS